MVFHICNVVALFVTCFCCSDFFKLRFYDVFIMVGVFVYCNVFLCFCSIRFEFLEVVQTTNEVVKICFQYGVDIVLIGFDLIWCGFVDVF